MNDSVKNKPATFNLNQHMARMLMSEPFFASLSRRIDKKEDLSGDQLDNLSDYFKSLPSEAAMKLWSVVGQASEKNAIGLHGRSGDFLIKMLAGDNS